MGNYYLAIDIGASSGRHILGYVEQGTMRLEEVYRFENGMKDVNGTKCWDVEELFASIKAGMKRCKELDKIPVSVGVDTWGVDFVLLDKDGSRIGEAVGYRDNRTRGMDEEVYKLISEEKLYERTGIQKQLYNTIYQLMAVKKQKQELLEEAETLLFMPDYFHYLLSGKKAVEYTIATTGQLVSPQTKDWDYELLDLLGYPKNIFPEMKKPGSVLGSLTEEVAAEVGFQCQVVLPASHDTGSAVMAVPSMGRETVYISSGTWSLMGVESTEAICNEASHKANLTNEGGYEYRYRFLKNIMGLWMIQSVRKEYDKKYSFAELCEMAEQEKEFPSRVDVNDDCFFAPDSMIQAIQKYCKDSGQKVPETPGEIAAVVYQSLAESYGQTVKEIEAITGKRYEAINIVGGGANADYLSQLTANSTGRTVYAGPTEATAIGNLVAQMIHAGEYESLEEARKAVFKSFAVKTFERKQ
ncbi:MAG: rhamnulokinase [Lachnospiraceae bacterium]|nr:rhamnulokinase [Lachnospiraceae bacterium]